MIKEQQKMEKKNYLIALEISTSVSSFKLAVVTPFTGSGKKWTFLGHNSFHPNEDI